MRKNKIYILFVILLLLSSCVDSTLDSLVDNETTIEAVGEEIIYDFSVHIPEAQELSTRSSADITDMQLLVFDENGRFLMRTKAILEGTQTIGGVLVRNFKAILLSSDEKRYIHFIANYDDWDSFPSTHEILNTDEGNIVPRLISGVTTYWNRFVFEDGLSTNSFNNRSFPLLRNKAKVELQINVPGFVVSEFAVYNAPALGTVVPFKYDETTHSLIFTEGTLSEVSPVALVPHQFVPYTPEAYIEMFEKNNLLADQKVFVVLKASLNGGGESYYKLDFLLDETTGELHDIIRNRIYRFIISRVDFTGYATAQEAALSPAANNVMGSVELMEYPSISDGTSFLKAEKSAEVFITTGTFETQIEYYRNLATNVTSPEAVEVTLMTPDPDNDIDFTYNTVTGRIALTVNRVPTDRVITHTLKVSVTDPGKNIFRYITIVLRSPYNFNFGVVNVNNNKAQNGEVEVSFDVPSTIPLNVFPISIYFQTKELYPNPINKDLKIEIINKKYRYEYRILDTKRGERVTLYFKRTYSNKTETIPVVCQYILNGTTITLN